MLHCSTIWVRVARSGLAGAAAMLMPGGLVIKALPGLLA